MTPDTIVYAVRKDTIIICAIPFSDVRADDYVFLTAIAAIRYTNEITREYSELLRVNLETRKS